MPLWKQGVSSLEMRTVLILYCHTGTRNRGSLKFVGVPFSRCARLETGLLLWRRLYHYELASQHNNSKVKGQRSEGLPITFVMFYIELQRATWNRCLLLKAQDLSRHKSALLLGFFPTSLRRKQRNRNRNDGGVLSTR
jgi:hypothetical protein